MEEDISTCLHQTGGSEFDGLPGFEKLRELYPETHQELADILQELVGPYLRRIRDTPFSASKRYSSEVVVFQDDAHRKRCLQRLNHHALTFPGKLLMWVDEGDHLHIVHDCARGNGTCRCQFAQSEDFRKHFRKPMRRIKFLSELSTTDWTNVFLYFIVSKRNCEPQVWIGGRLQRLPTNDQIVRWRDVQTRTRDILGGEDSGNGRDDQEEERYIQGDSGNIQENYGQSGKKKRETPMEQPKRKKTKFERISEQVLSVLKDLYCIPSTDIRKLLIHTDKSLIFYDPGNSKQYESACEMFEHRFIDYSLVDLKYIYSRCTPVWYANDLNPFNYYHDEVYSLNIIDKLIRFQLGDDDERIIEFLNNIKQWFDKKGWDGNVKCNAICIVGPPNCGKNYFWDMFAALAYNTGHIGRVNNKTNRFALQECYQRRFIMGNEINMEDGAKEDFKKLCEGGAFNINVKFKADKIYTKAPVCLISNKTIDICYDTAFKDVRLKTMFWKKADFLQESDKKPYPMCIFDLFEKYNVSLLH